MSKTDSKSRGGAKRGGLLSSFFASGRVAESEEDHGPDAQPVDGVDHETPFETVDVRDDARRGPHVDHAEAEGEGEGAEAHQPRARALNGAHKRGGKQRRDGAREAEEVAKKPKNQSRSAKSRRDTAPEVEAEAESEPVSAEVQGPGDAAPQEGDGERGVVVSGSGGTPQLAEEEVYTTGFSDVANARLWRRTREARKRDKERPRGFRNVFTPTRPKRQPQEFIGRRALIGSVIEAIEEECAHVIMCAETGLGKTSLANVVAEFAKESGYLVVRITGTEDLSFSRFIRTLFEELFHQIDETPAGRVLMESLGVQDMNELLQDNAMDLVSEFLGEENLDITRVIRALDRLSDNQAIAIIDDYDQIKSRELKTRLTQVMKALSDQGGWLSFFVLGRGESPSDLLQDDVESLPNAVGLYADPLALHEIEEVIHEGGQKIGIQFNQDTVQAIARLSQGVPNVVQWLSFLSVRRTVRRDGVVVEIEDLANIVSDAVTKIDARLRNLYDEACRYSKGNSNADLLYLAVRAPCTPSGLFSAATMHVLSRQIIGRKWKESEIHTALLPLCGKGPKSILRKLDTSEGTFYRFAHPTMRAVVMLKKIVRIPLLSDMRTREVDAAYLPSPQDAAAASAAASLSHATHAPAQGSAETPQDAMVVDMDAGSAPLEPGEDAHLEPGEDQTGHEAVAENGIGAGEVLDVEVIAVPEEVHEEASATDETVPEEVHVLDAQALDSDELEADDGVVPPVADEQEAIAADTEEEPEDRDAAPVGMDSEPTAEQAVEQDRGVGQDDEEDRDDGVEGMSDVAVAAAAMDIQAWDDNELDDLADAVSGDLDMVEILEAGEVDSAPDEIVVEAGDIEEIPAERDELAADDTAPEQTDQPDEAVLQAPSTERFRVRARRKDRPHQEAPDPDTEEPETATPDTAEDDTYEDLMVIDPLIGTDAVTATSALVDDMDAADPGESLVEETDEAPVVEQDGQAEDETAVLHDDEEGAAEPVLEEVSEPEATALAETALDPEAADDTAVGDVAEPDTDAHDPVLALAEVEDLEEVEDKDGPRAAAEEPDAADDRSEPASLEREDRHGDLTSSELASSEEDVAVEADADQAAEESVQDEEAQAPSTDETGEAIEADSDGDDEPDVFEDRLAGFTGSLDEDDEFIGDETETLRRR